MNCKICPYCHQNSYSAATYGNWICPYCKKDITLVEYSPIRNKHNSEIEYKETKKTSIF